MGTGVVVGVGGGAKHQTEEVVVVAAAAAAATPSGEEEGVVGGSSRSPEELSPLEVRRIHEEFWRALGVVEARGRGRAAGPVSLHWFSIHSSVHSIGLDSLAIRSSD